MRAAPPCSARPAHLPMLAQIEGQLVLSGCCYLGSWGVARDSQKKLVIILIGTVRVTIIDITRVAITLVLTVVTISISVRIVVIVIIVIINSIGTVLSSFLVLVGYVVITTTRITMIISAICFVIDLALLLLELHSAIGFYSH